MSRPTAVLATVAATLAATLLAAAPAQAAGEVLVKQRAALTAADRATGVTPPPGGPSLASAEITVEVHGETYFPQAGVRLAQPVPTGGTAVLRFGLGHRSTPNNCQVVGLAEKTIDYDGTDFSLTGGYNPDYFPTPDRPYECALIALESQTGTVLDAFVGSLVNDYQQPDLSVGAVEVAEKTQKVLKLVPGVWTTLDVAVGNSGSVDAGTVSVAGAGKRLKVKGGTVDVGRESTGSVRIQVRLKGRKKTTLTLTAAGAGVSASRQLAVRPAKPAKRPATGGYRSKDGRVSFRIKGGKVVGFRARMQTTCGGYPGLPTYTTNTYDHPRTKVPKSGVVDSLVSGSGYSTRLVMVLKGKKVTRGLFRYAGPNRCSATASFTARRVG